MALTIQPTQDTPQPVVRRAMRLLKRQLLGWNKGVPYAVLATLHDASGDELGYPDGTWMLRITALTGEHECLSTQLMIEYARQAGDVMTPASEPDPWTTTPTAVDAEATP